MKHEFVANNGRRYLIMNDNAAFFRIEIENETYWRAVENDKPIWSLEILKHNHETPP